MENYTMSPYMPYQSSPGRLMPGQQGVVARNISMPVQTRVASPVMNQNLHDTVNLSTSPAAAAVNEHAAAEEDEPLSSLIFNKMNAFMLALQGGLTAWMRWMNVKEGGKGVAEQILNGTPKAIAPKKEINGFFDYVKDRTNLIFGGGDYKGVSFGERIGSIFKPSTGMTYNISDEQKALVKASRQEYNAMAQELSDLARGEGKYAKVPFWDRMKELFIKSTSYNATFDNIQEPMKGQARYLNGSNTRLRFRNFMQNIKDTVLYPYHYITGESKKYEWRKFNRVDYVNRNFAELTTSARSAVDEAFRSNFGSVVDVLRNEKNPNYKEMAQRLQKAGFGEFTEDVLKQIKNISGQKTQDYSKIFEAVEKAAGQKVKYIRQGLFTPAEIMKGLKTTGFKNFLNAAGRSIKTAVTSAGHTSAGGKMAILFTAGFGLFETIPKLFDKDYTGAMKSVGRNLAMGAGMVGVQSAMAGTLGTVGALAGAAVGGPVGAATGAFLAGVGGMLISWPIAEKLLKPVFKWTGLADAPKTPEQPNQ